MKIPFFAIDTPADVLLLNAILEGRPSIDRCVMWRDVEHVVKEVDGRKYTLPVCPAGCVKSVDDVQLKCGIKYKGILSEQEKQAWKDKGGHP